MQDLERTRPAGRRPRAAWRRRAATAALAGTLVAGLAGCAAGTTPGAAGAQAPATPASGADVAATTAPPAAAAATEPALTAPEPDAPAPTSDATSDATSTPGLTASAPPAEPEPTQEPEPTPPATSPAPSTAPSPTASTSPAPAPSDSAPVALRSGDRGERVRAAQERLSDLGYWLGDADGSYGELTRQAVLALQGAAGLQQDGVLGPRTSAALADGVRPQASTSSGRALEIVRDAGLALFVVDGEVQLALHTSTGTFETYVRDDGAERLADTPAGTFAVTWAERGWTDAALGRLYSPRYFHPDGIALHGSASVPGYPASHGCARVTTAAMDMVWARDLMPVGSTVVVR
ncbi:L,D-transpeptidase family protein [uncultured Pseudokineococcus sp.]|uniref:L,D-transpeptidase family protein n=1 Tax=uncultured Pseudokineococcus sp. TaxID=1642928 RepID=UPI0026098607|nr:L,D-transpeptidase family protein [uncultured Pseudokineococcus sp.]